MKEAKKKGWAIRFRGEDKAVPNALDEMYRLAPRETRNQYLLFLTIMGVWFSFVFLILNFMCKSG